MKEEWRYSPELIEELKTEMEVAAAEFANWQSTQPEKILSITHDVAIAEDGYRELYESLTHEERLIVDEGVELTRARAYTEDAYAGQAQERDRRLGLSTGQ